MIAEQGLSQYIPPFDPTFDDLMDGIAENKRKICSNQEFEKSTAELTMSALEYILETVKQLKDAKFP